MAFLSILNDMVPAPSAHAFSKTADSRRRGRPQRRREEDLMAQETKAAKASRRSAKTEARRQEIVDISARLFARRGYHATGINELCDATELGKGALYHYIRSKEALLAAIHDRVMDELMLGADRVAETGGSPAAQLAMLGEELLDVIHRYPDHVWVFLHDFPALTGENAEHVRGRRTEYARRVADVVQAGIDGGEFRELDPWLAQRAWLGMHYYTYLWLSPGGSPTDLAKQFADIFLSGIMRPSGETEDHGAE